MPWRDEFDWSAVNYAPLTVGGLFLIVGLWWLLGAKDRYKGPVRTIDELEAELAPDDEPRTTTTT